VLSNGFNENEQFYAWVAVGSKYVAFRLLDTRSAAGAATILGGFNGTLMVDGLTSYPAAAKGAPGEAPRFKVANCHAHARRRLVEVEKHWPAESKFAVALYRQLYDVEREGKAPGADLLALRQTKSRPLIDELFSWAHEQQARPEVLPSSGLAKAVGYLLNHEAGLRVFLDDPAVPIDNNESERAVRPTVLGRVNYQGSRSRRGTEVHAILSTLVESAKRCDVPPEVYLLAAAETALMKVGAVLLPDEFKRQLDELRAAPPPVQTV
jgi:transposase